MSAENATVGSCEDPGSGYQEILLGAWNFLFLIVANLMIWLTIKFIRSQPSGRKLVKKTSSDPVLTSSLTRRHPTSRSLDCINWVWSSPFYPLLQLESWPLAIWASTRHFSSSNCGKWLSSSVGFLLGPTGSHLYNLRTWTHQCHWFAPVGLHHGPPVI